MEKRIDFIDLIETLAIIFVVLYHSTIYSYNFIDDTIILYYVRYFSRAILSTCVPLFFFVNGYLLLTRPFNLKKHIIKIVRFILLIAIWAPIIRIIYMFIENEPFSFRNIITSIIELDITWNMNFFWYIGALICIYILFPALKYLFDNNIKAFVFITISIAALTFGIKFLNEIIDFFIVITGYNFRHLNVPIVNMLNPFRGAYGYSYVYFCLGGLFCKYEYKIKEYSRLKRNLISGVGLFLSCFLLFCVGVFYSKFIDGKMWDIVWNGYDTIFTFFNVTFIYLLCLNYNYKNIIIKNISCNTLGIYFLHAIFIRLSKPLISNIEILCNVPFGVIYGMLIIFICLLICLLIRKIPIISKLI